MRVLSALTVLSLTSGEQDPGFTDWFSSELKTVENQLLAVEGSIPSYVSGLFVQSGPGRFEMGNMSFGHALDGYSKTVRFHFDNSSTETQVMFSTDFLQSRFYKNSLKKGRITAGMTAAETKPPSRAKLGPANGLAPNDNNYIKPQKIGDTELMTCDTLFVSVMDQEYSEITDTIAPALPGSILQTQHWDDSIVPTGHLCIQATMAHGVVDEQGRYEVAMGCQTLDGLSQYHILFRINPAQVNKRELIAKIKLKRRPSYMHQNGFTASSYVLIGTPLYMDFAGVLRGKGLAEGGLVSPEGDNTTFQVVSKADGSVREFETDGFLMGHVINSYDDGEDIVVDVTYSTPQSGGFFKRYLLDVIMDPTKRDHFEKCTAIRYRLKADGSVEKSLTLPDEPVADIELPVVHPHYEGKSYCVFWGVQFSHEGRSFASTALVKRNVCTGEAINAYQEGLYVSEHRFVPSPGSTEEDEGALIGLVYDGFKDKSFLQVLDAKTLKHLARVDLGIKVPFPVHTTWYGANAPQGMSV